MAKTLVYFSLVQLKMAYDMARFCFEQEVSPNLDKNSKLAEQTSMHSATAVLMSFGFLEATINETFDSCALQPEIMEDIEPHVLKRLYAVYQELRSKELSVSGKYQLFLHVADKTPFDKGAEPLQSVSDLLELRNNMVHYRSEWVDSGELGVKTQSSYLEKRLQNRFSDNRFYSTNNPFFPQRCFSYECAKWSITCAIDFVDQFFSRIKLDHPRYSLNKEKLP